MDTRYIRHARTHARGAIQPVVIAALVVVVVLAAAAWFLIIKPHQDLMQSDNGGHPSTPVSAGREAAPPPANVEAMSLNKRRQRPLRYRPEHRTRGRLSGRPRSSCGGGVTRK